MPGSNLMLPELKPMFSSTVYTYPSLGGLVGWSIVPYTKGCGFIPGSGHMPRLWVRCPAGNPTEGNRLMFPSHIYVSLSLSQLLLSKTDKHILR